MLQNVLKALLSQLLEGGLLLLQKSLLFSVALALCGLSHLLLFHQLLFALLVEEIDRSQVIVRSSKAFDVNTHAFKHLVLVTVGMKSENLGLVLLEKLDQGELGASVREASGHLG